MSAIVFVLSEEASATVRAHCNAHGADLDGLACDAVRCLMDILDDEWGGPWLPVPDGLATGQDHGGTPSVEPESTESVWEQAQREVDMVRTMLDEHDKIAREIRECVAELRAAGMPILAIADELRRLGTRPAGGDTK